MLALMRAFRQAVSMLPQGLHRRLAWLVPLMAVSAVLEMVGLALVLPLVNSVMRPDEPLSLPVIGRLPGLADFTGAQVLMPLALGVSLFYLVKNALLLVAAWAENRFVMDAVSRFSTGMLRTYMAAPYVFHLQHNSAELIRNVNLACDDVFRGVLKPMLRLISEGMIVAAIFTVLLAADPLVTVSMGAFLALLLGIFYVATHRAITEGGRRSQTLHALALQQLNQGLGSFKEIRVRRRERFFVDGFARLREEMARIQVFNQTIVELPRLSIETVLVFAFALAVLVVRGRGGAVAEILPLLALYALAGFRLMPTFNKLVLYANTARYSLPALANVCSHIDELQHVSPPPGAEHAPPLVPRRSVRLQGIRYTYPGKDAPALDDIDLTVPRGASVGLIGPSGAGKTTLADVLLGLLEPQRGSLVVDDQPVGANLAAWQRGIGYIPQSIYVLDDSIRRNVAIGLSDDEIDDAAVWEALRLARLDDFVARLPGELGTRLGEHGSLLSGGQRQRIGIARALYHRPEVLVMDEATSALDAETEREVTAAIDALAGERTIVLIAHRLSTVRACDTVYLMEGGRIADHGPFEQLAARNPQIAAALTTMTEKGTA